MGGGGWWWAVVGGGGWHLGDLLRIPLPRLPASWLLWVRRGHRRIDPTTNRRYAEPSRQPLIPKRRTNRQYDKILANTEHTREYEEIRRTATKYEEMQATMKTLFKHKVKYV